MSQILASSNAHSNEDINVQSSGSSSKKCILKKLKKLFRLSHVHFPKEQIDEARQYNKFLEYKAPRGYKYKRYDDGGVFIIDMSSPERSDIVAFIGSLFGAYNARFAPPPPPPAPLNYPMIIGGDSFHYSPDGSGARIAPDVCIRPNKIYVTNPTVPHPGPPPSDINGNSHARIVLHSPKNARDSQGIRLREMIAWLWTQGVARPQKWDFGTFPENAIILPGLPIPATGCTGPGLPNFTISIPVIEVFYNPPNPVPADYASVIPAALTPTIDPGATLDIDLYLIQQMVLDSQKK
ncbi:23119_t:CDS:2 [Gigaspora rosea]|nr:23119_t:CDS:2 [Gigaspora rosea]